jgi:aspartyl-tRNA(Asn)/glutamyl-tRNA(Gln) amidotransferase subunit B
VSDGDMSQGSMRCDVNISLRPFGQSEFGTRTELKNLNSFKFIEKAIHTEVERQKDILEDGGRIIQETRLYDADKDETRPMRSKEFANDYRYFPEPDLLPIEIDDAYIEAIRATLPELPDTKLARFIADFGLTEYDASVLTSSRPMANYFERVAEQCGDAKLAANWCMGDLSKLLNQQDLTIDNCPIAPEDLGLLLLRIKDNTISGNIAKTVFQAMSDAQGSADEIIAAKGLKQVTDSGAIAALVDQVIADNLDQFNAFKGGKDKLIGFFVGQVMKLSKGQANPGQVNDILQAKAKE